MANASSAIARMVLASCSTLRLSTGRTCGRPARLSALGVAGGAGALAPQQRRRLAAHEALAHRPVDGDVARQLDHRAIDQLDRRRGERDDMPGRVHRLVEARKMADAEGLV